MGQKWPQNLIVPNSACSNNLSNCVKRSLNCCILHSWSFSKIGWKGTVTYTLCIIVIYCQITGTCNCTMPRWQFWTETPSYWLLQKFTDTFNTLISQICVFHFSFFLMSGMLDLLVNVTSPKYRTLIPQALATFHFLETIQFYVVFLKNLKFP